jgi:hypothetical protein
MDAKGDFYRQGAEEEETERENGPRMDANERE